MEKNANVVAIDVGYGNVKHAFMRSGELKLGIFPAIAPSASNSECVSVGMQRRNTVIVDVENMSYEVGVDAHLASDSSYRRITDENYPESTQYHALLLGALSYMGQRDVDMLVLGLPLLTFNNHKAVLEKKFIGTHKVPRIQHPNSKEPPLDVNVKQVMVLPQPMGGLFAYAAANQDRTISNETSLIVDIGFFTVDWVYSQGFKPYPAKSSSLPGGMNSVYQAITESLRGELGRNINDVSRVDHALRNGEKEVRLFGKMISLEKHIQAGVEKAKQFVASLANTVGDGVTLDNIVLVGGGSNFFKDLIQERYPDHTITLLKDPAHSNVTGFQFAGLKSVNLVKKS